MTPGTRVRIHYPGRPYHGMSGTIRSRRQVGTMKSHQVQLDEPIMLPGAKKPHDVVTLIAKRLQAIKGQPRPTLDNVIEWYGEAPEPSPIRWEGGDAEPMVIVVGGWRVAPGEAQP